MGRSRGRRIQFGAWGSCWGEMGDRIDDDGVEWQKYPVQIGKCHNQIKDCSPDGLSWLVEEGPMNLLLFLTWTKKCTEPSFTTKRSRGRTVGMTCDHLRPLLLSRHRSIGSGLKMSGGSCSRAALSNTSSKSPTFLIRFCLPHMYGDSRLLS